MTQNDTKPPIWRRLHPQRAFDLLWLEQQMEQDDYVHGQMIFGLGLSGEYQYFELQRTALPQLLDAYNAQHQA